MIPRLSESRIRKIASQFPVVVITGPRQSGKTTLAKALFPLKPYLNLERPDTYDRLKGDPLGTLKPLTETGAIIDEAQRFPELTSWLQALVDENPKPGTWILTGSNQPLLKQTVSQSLAGRAAYVRLHPFCVEEVRNHERFVSASTDQALTGGWYPPLFDRAFSSSDWYEQYVSTYLERDLSQMVRVKELSQFRNFLMLCAGRSGQVLNLSDLGRASGTNHTTARQWLSVLESSYLVYLLQPYHENYQKRITKSPKLYFYDSGLASWLIGIRGADQLNTHPLRGALFETLVVSDTLKRYEALGNDSRFYYWNAPSVGEVDIVRFENGLVHASEIKSTATFRPHLTDGLLRWAEIAQVPTDRLELVYDGDESLVFKGIRVNSWRSPLL